eukprot:GHVU01135519.1.p1 GENE.GHVU01135519.1~~GHVU01135519.1.p1  ORF type:complete len:242 (+),score=52.11 GHVU01135519.1:101-727(+)
MEDDLSARDGAADCRGHGGNAEDPLSIGDAETTEDDNCRKGGSGCLKISATTRDDAPVGRTALASTSAKGTTGATTSGDADPNLHHHPDHHDHDPHPHQQQRPCCRWNPGPNSVAFEWSCSPDEAVRAAVQLLHALGLDDDNNRCWLSAESMHMFGWDLCARMPIDRTESEWERALHKWVRQFPPTGRVKENTGETRTGGGGGGGGLG